MGAQIHILVLGAWGCGAFRNDPEVVAAELRSLLQSEFSGRFRLVVIAIKDIWDRHDVLQPFRGAFSDARAVQPDNRVPSLESALEGDFELLKRLGPPHKNPRKQRDSERSVGPRGFA